MTREDLFLDRSHSIVDRLSRYVRGRDKGESAADAVLRELRVTLVGYIGRETVAGRRAAEVSRDALVLLDEIEDLLGEKVLNYARRAAE